MDSVQIDDATMDIDNPKTETSTDPFAGFRRVPGKFPPLALLILVVEV